MKDFEVELAATDSDYFLFFTMLTCYFLESSIELLAPTLFILPMGLQQRIPVILLDEVCVFPELIF